MNRRLCPWAAALGAALALGGCVSLFPKQPPEQLYRFGPPPATVTGVRAARFTVIEDRLGFNEAADGDRILTVAGDKVAYIKGGRWGATAPTLFQQALESAFDEAGGPARLAPRGTASKADLELRLDVSRFEVRYAAGAAPTILVRVHASLVGYEKRSPAGARDFQAEIPASGDRLGAIVQAFDQATTQVLGQIVAWVGQSGSPA